MILNIFLVLVLLFAIGQLAMGQRLDDSDYDKKNRSGLSVHIDARTGCHYLQGHGIFGFGSSLIPRVDAEGNHICEHKVLND